MYRMLQVLEKLIFLFCAFFLSVSSVQAQIFISEVDLSSEFIEIYTDEDIIIENFVWSELTGSGEEKKYEELRVELSAGDVFVLEMSRKLNNSGEHIRLYDGEVLLDEREVPALEDGKTYQKNSETGDWEWSTATKGIYAHESDKDGNREENEEMQGGEEQQEEDTQEESGEEESEENEEVEIFEKNIIISEMLPNPEGTDGDDTEFIELYNGATVAVDIAGYFLVDLSGKKYIFPENTVLLPNEYKAVYRRDHKITLNNSAETIVFYTPSEEEISRLSFSSSASSGKSFIFENGGVFTQTVTPSAKNVVSLPASSTESQETVKYKENFSLFPQSYRDAFRALPENKNIVQTDVQLLITKISLSSKPDFIEVTCIECNAQSANPAGVMISIDGIVYQLPNIPLLSQVKNGDVLRFEFSKTADEASIYQKEKVRENNTSVFVFPVVLNGLVTSDEVIAIGNLAGEILDVMCYADMNSGGRLITSEKKDIGFAILHDAWKGEVKEWGCVNSAVFPKNAYFVRKKNAENIFIDTNTKHDFVRERDENVNNLGEIDSGNEERKLVFSHVVLSSKGIFFDILNISNTPVQMNSWYIANHQSFFLDIKNKEHESDFLLYPNQSIRMQIVSTAKKYAKENLMLSLRNEAGEIQDAFCVNRAKDEKGVKKSIFTLSDWRQKGVWKKERKNYSCFEYRRETKVQEYTRTNFEFPSSLFSYELFEHEAEEYFQEQEQEQQKQKESKGEENSEKTHVENLCITAEPEKNGLRISGNISACLSEKNAKHAIEKVRIYIHEKNYKEEISVQKINKNKNLYSDTYEFFIEKPFKKGFYSVDMRFFTDEEKYSVPMHFMRVRENVLAQEFGTITFSHVLPNPEGRDKNNETVVLKNRESFPHWVRNWTITLESVTKKGLQQKTKNLPHMFVEKNDIFVLANMYFPSLKNGNARLVLKDAWGNVVSEVSWSKARNNEWFGENAPKYTEVKKRTSQKKSKSSNNKTSNKTEKIKKLKFKKEEVFFGTLEKIITVTDEKDANLITKKLAYIHIENVQKNKNTENMHPKIRDVSYIFYEIPDYLLHSEDAFQAGEQLLVHVKNGEVSHVKFQEKSQEERKTTKQNTQEHTKNILETFAYFMALILVFSLSFLIFSVLHFFKKKA